MIIRPAKENEYERVRQFYYDLIDEMQNHPYCPAWQKDIYPRDADLASYVRRGELYLAEDGDAILGAMVLNHNSNEGYAGAPWLVDAAPGEVTALHLLGVSPSRSRQGIGMAMVQEALRLARADKQKTVRLDVLEGNLPAERLYPKAGFRYVDYRKLFYDDVGLCGFTLYEYPLI